MKVGPEQLPTDPAGGFVPPPPGGPGPTGAPPMPGNSYPLVGSGAAHMSKPLERELRGPTLLGAQGNRNQVSEDTIARVGGRNEGMAQQEYQVAIDQERQARVRQEAAMQVQTEQAEEMAQRQADFDGTVKQLGKMGQIDHDRFWASRSTGQKIAGVVELMLSGFTGAQSMVQKRIEDDVKAQEFAYYATRDTANAKQTAFSMAMQKYQNADAARSMARAAAIDVTQAQLAQVGAKWKGTEAANRADISFAALQDEKMMQIANGIQFIPSQYMGRRFLDPRTGLMYSEAEAKAMSGKVDERDFENRKQVAGIGGQLAVEGAKADTAMYGKVDEGAGKISTQLQQAGVPQARAAAERALQAMNKSEGGRIEANVRTIGGTTLGNMVMPDDANAREQAYQDFSNAAMKAMMGNVTANELDRAEKALGTAADPASRRRAIAAAMGTLEEIEKNAKAGESPRAQAEFDARRENAKGDKPAAPPSASKGWK